MKIQSAGLFAGFLLVLLCGWIRGAVAEAGIDLMQKYPTTLTAGDSQGKNLRTWRITDKDIYHISKAVLDLPDGLKIEIEEADLGVGVSQDGAVWAAVIPRAKGAVTSRCAPEPEPITSLWLRFHPSKLGSLFPAGTVLSAGNAQLLPRMREIAFGRMVMSWQGGRRAMIPETKNMTVLSETKEGELRFFMVDTDAATSEYVDSFNYPWREVQEDPKPREAAPAVPDKKPTVPGPAQ